MYQSQTATFSCTVHVAFALVPLSRQGVLTRVFFLHLRQIQTQPGLNRTQSGPFQLFGSLDMSNPFPRLYRCLVHTDVLSTCNQTGTCCAIIDKLLATDKHNVAGSSVYYTNY